MPFIIPPEKRVRPLGLSKEQHFLLDVMEMCQELKYMKRQGNNGLLGVVTVTDESPLYKQAKLKLEELS